MKLKSVKKLVVTLAMTTAVVVAATISASACTTIYVGGNLMEEGTPFVARTEDYGADMNKLWFISQAGDFKAGEKFLGCPAYGEFEWTFTHDSYRFTYFTNDIYYNGVCPECGEGSQQSPVTHPSYTEFGTNDKGVSVSATETISGNAQVKTVDPNRQTKVDGKVGIEETDIPTILLAEAATAREGVELLAKIYDEYGCYYDSGIFICDRDEVWYIENCSGTQYVAIKLNDDMIFLEPNIAVIGRVDLDDPNVIASDRLIEVAKQAGTFVGDEAENIIDFRASYANLGTAEAPRVGTPRMADGLKFLDPAKSFTPAQLFEDNSKFTISNLDASNKLVPLYTNITFDREGGKLTKDDVFNYYKLSSIGKPSNQEIEIFQLFNSTDYPRLTDEMATVGWVGVGNMSNNVFVPYYPMLIDDMYKGYQVSTPVVTQSAEKPQGFSTWTTKNDGKYVAYPENWQDSYYFTFEGLGGYILYAQQIDGAPVTAADKQYVLDQLAALQQELYDEFVTVNELNAAGNARALATKNGIAMAKKTHKLGVELVNFVTSGGSALFSDVNSDNWYYKAVDYVTDRGFMGGVTADTFAANDHLTRGMLVQILWSMAQKPATDGQLSFADVGSDAWYAQAVNWAASSGIVAGVGEGQFAPERSVTREEFALILYNYAKRPSATHTLSFADTDQIASWAMDAMGWAVQAGIISGKDANLVDAAGTATRTEVAQMMMNFHMMDAN